MQYVVHYTDKRGAGCSLTTSSKAELERRLKSLCRRGIEANAYAVSGRDREHIGGTQKLDGRWIWSYYNGDDVFTAELNS